MSAGPVLVTGATGFIGRAVVGRLLADGMPVRAGRRGPVAPVGGEATHCDLDDPASLARALEGASAVVHAACRDPARMPAQLGALLDAASAAGVGRIVFFSSVAVHGGREGHLREDAEPAGPADPYGAAKRACEALLREWAREPGRDRSAIILRPGIVYGRGSRLWIDRPLAGLRAGTLGLLGRRGEGLAGLVHVDDVAGATRLALARLLAPGGPGFQDAAFTLVGSDRPSWNGYFQALAERAGIGPLRTIGPLELALLRTLAVPAKILTRLKLPAPAGLAQFPAAGELRLFARRASYDSGAAERGLGWRPSVSLAQGLALSLPVSASKT